MYFVLDMFICSNKIYIWILVVKCKGLQLDRRYFRNQEL